MTEIHRDRAGRIDMYPDDTAHQMGCLRATGEDFDSAWQAARGKIDSPGPVGGGPMGKAFTALYDEPKRTIVDAMVQIAGVYQRLADNGDRAVQSYEAGNDAATSVFTR
jgi:hypothetical protein